MSLRQLKWLTIVAPIVFLVIVDALRRTLQPGFMQSWIGDLLVGGVVLFAVLLFSETIFGRIERMQTSLARQNRELRSLHDAGLDIAGELGVEPVLQKVVDHATDLIGARYGALSVPGPGGGIETFLTSGITAEERALIGPLPIGHGLLAVVLQEGRPLRTPDLTLDPRFVGFPPHHPSMRSLVAVPIVSAGRILGNLYLAEKQGAPEFSAEDEETLVRFATQAALAIQNAWLHHQVRELAIAEERDRIAREMHDSLAQVLGYVITKAQAVQELLRRDQTERASTQVRQLAEAARAAYADVREGILALRTSVGQGRPLEEALEDYLRRWKDQSDIDVRLRVDSQWALAALPPMAELQLLRIIQEALTNVRKHAGAKQVDVCIRTADDRLVEAVIADNGHGFDPAQARSEDDLQPHFGLSTMRERAESVGGSIEITSAPGEGTRVVVRLPLAPSRLRDEHELPS